MKAANPSIGPYGLPARLYELSKKYGFKIAGCDLKKNEMQRIEKVFGDKEAEIEKDGLYMPGTGRNIMRVRDMAMTDKILEYQNKSNKPIVVIIGSNHGDSINSQHLLQEKGALRYVYINQSQSKK